MDVSRGGCEMIFDRQFFFRCVTIFASFVSVIMLIISTHYHISEGWDLLLFFSGFILFVVVFFVFLTLMVRYFFYNPISKKERQKYKSWFYIFVCIFLGYCILFFHIANCQHITEGVENIEETRGEWQRIK